MPARFFNLARTAAILSDGLYALAFSKALAMAAIGPSAPLM
jgi:hypothetical protein